MPKTALPVALTVVRAGLVTRAALVAAGVDDDLGDRLARTGTWRRLAPSVYLASPGPPTDGQLVEAAVAHAGGDLVVTGSLACRAADLRDAPAGGPVDVLIPPGTRVVSTPYVRVRQSGRAARTWTRGGVRYAMPARALGDAARRTGDLREVRAVVLAAVADGACGVEDLQAELTGGARRGSALLRRAVQDARAGAWSAPEAEAADLVRRGARARLLPRFALNPLLTVAGQVVGRPDGWLLGTAVGWQVDSRRHHSSQGDFDATLAVHDRFARHGLTLLHVTPRRLRQQGQEWVESLAAAVAAGRQQPHGLVVTPHDVLPLQTP